MAISWCGALRRGLQALVGARLQSPGKPLSMEG
jgi:hypothetical protein